MATGILVKTFCKVRDSKWLIPEIRSSVSHQNAYHIQKRYSKANAADISDTRSAAEATHVSACCAGRCTIQGMSHFTTPAAAEVTKLPTIMLAVRGRNERLLLQSERKGSAAERMASASAKPAPFKPSSEQGKLGPGRNLVTEVAASSWLRICPQQPPLHPIQKDGLSHRLTIGRSV
jgi:hypothetical protein